MSKAASPVSVSAAEALPADDADGADTAAESAAATATATATLDYADASTDTPLPVARPTESLRSRTIRGTLWTTGGYGASQVVRLGANLVLTRLLAPDAFGLMNLVNTFIQGLQGFSDVGIGPAIIQNKRGDDPAFLNTAWTIQVLRGVALTAVATLIAWPVARFYGDARLLWLLPVAGSTALIAGFNATALFTLNRHLEVRKLTVRNLAAQVIGAAVMIAWALVSPNIWALVAGNIAAAVLSLALSHSLLPGVRNRFRWEPTAASELMKFGRWIFVSTILTFLALQGDRLIFGKLLTKSDFGVYGVAAMMAALPTMTLLRLGGTVVFPAYSRARAEGDDQVRKPDGTPSGANRHFQRVFDLVRLPLLAAGGLATAGLIAGGPQIIQILYDDRYHAAGWMLQLLAVCGWFQVLQVTNGSALLALGSPKSVAAANVAKLLSMAAFIPLGFWARGLPGAIGGMIVSDVIKYVVSAIAAQRKGLHMLAKDVFLSVLVGITAAGAIGAARLGAPLIGRSGRIEAVAELALIAVLCCATWVPVIVRATRRRKAVA